MELSNEFDVSVPVEEAWEVLTDLERIAPCMPGAQLQEVDGEDYRGIVKVKVGPITAQFKGVARFVEKDVEARRAVLKAEGRDTGGKGNASATITAQLSPTDAGTHVSVVTDLHITGKVAQFGRGALADVSTKLLGQFVDQLESTVLGTPPQPEAAAEPVAEPLAATADTATSGAGGGPASSSAAGTATGPRTINAPEPEPVDLVGTAGVPVLKRLAPIFAALLSFVLLRRWRRARRKRRG